jgi:hypothetical protein
VTKGAIRPGHCRLGMLVRLADNGKPGSHFLLTVVLAFEKRRAQGRDRIAVE